MINKISILATIAAFLGIFAGFLGQIEVFVAACSFSLVLLCYILVKSSFIGKKETVMPKDLLNGVEILVADDVKELREFIRIILEKAGAKVTVCKDGEETLTLTDSKKYDLILLDLNMPGKNGCEIAKEMRISGKNKETYLVALTASGLLDLGNKHIEAGFNDYIEKPVKPETLVRKITLKLLKDRQIEDASSGKKIVSYYEHDPQYKKTIETFVTDLPQRVDGIQRDFEKGKLKELSDKLHSLKGLGGMAGFPIISDKAGKIEDKLNHEQFSDQIKNINKDVNELILLCRKTTIKKK